jgi:uncharacterized coiled-coil protein SlyX
MSEVTGEPGLTNEQRIEQLEEQVARANATVAQISAQLSDSEINLSVMRDRFTEELNTSLGLRGQIVKMQQQRGTDNDGQG